MSPAVGKASFLTIKPSRYDGAPGNGGLRRRAETLHAARTLQINKSTTTAAVLTTFASRAAAGCVSLSTDSTSLAPRDGQNRRYPHYGQCIGDRYLAS